MEAVQELEHELERMALQSSVVNSEGKRRQRKRANNLFISRLNKHRITKNIHLLNDFRKAFDLSRLRRYPETPYTATKLLKTSEDYIRASTAFRTNNKRFFTISKITRVDNTFHILQYKLMKDKYRNIYGESPLCEKLLFHGTKQEFLDSICTNNFDISKVRHHKYGYGVSFAKSPIFASLFHRANQRKYSKVMIITQMFWGGLDRGTKDMIVPRRPRYTSANAEKTVIVKFDQASFYPLYIVYYKGLHPQFMKGQ